MSPPADNRPEPRQAAVVDVGSNSVRLVTYRLEGRAIWTVYNEKALAGLGRDLPATGRLSRDGVQVALTALRRFRTVLRGWDEAEIVCMATAAVREAKDGAEFVQQIRRVAGFDVRVLTGEEEARYAAMGVLAGQPDARGLVGDLGGSSLELVRLGDGAPEPGVTLPLGPFALGAPKALNLDRMRRTVDERLAPHAKAFASREFHAVGGAWRNLALLHMTLADYPLRIAHQYEMTRGEALDVARVVSRLSKSSLEHVPGLSKKRYETMPYAALVLEALIEALGVERVVVSAYGLREGALLDQMEPQLRALDPLIEGCEALTAGRGLSPELGPALEAWLTPAFRRLPPVFAPRDGVLVAAACRLSDLGARLHPDHRAELAFEQVLRAPIAGMTHAERAFLAATVFARHSSNPTTPEERTLTRLLSPDQRQRARAVGAAIRLGYDLAGRNHHLLARSRLEIGPDSVTLKTDPDSADMLQGEQTSRRAAALASALRLKLQMA